MAFASHWAVQVASDISGWHTETRYATLKAAKAAAKGRSRGGKWYRVMHSLTGTVAGTYKSGKKLARSTNPPIPSRWLPVSITRKGRQIQIRTRGR
jgi:hypothetical protein